MSETDFPGGNLSDSARRLDRDTLRDQVADILENMILEGRWQPGDLLPSQAKLAETFGVSVTVVREAIESLRARKLVNVIHGKGAIVLPPSPSPLLSDFRMLAEREMLTLLDLWEARFLLEPHVAALAAQRATPEQLNELRAILEQMHECQEKGDRNQLAEADVRFHKMLASCTGNVALTLILEALSSLLLKSVKLTSQRPIHSPSDHSAVLEAVCSQDAEAARAAMQTHLERGYQDALAIAKLRGRPPNDAQSQEAERKAKGGDE